MLYILDVLAKRKYKRFREPDLFSGVGPADAGYRIRPGQSGLDYFDTNADIGRFLGLIVRKMFPWWPLRIAGGVVLCCVILYFSFSLLDGPVLIALGLVGATVLAIVVVEMARQAGM